jgi:hypothetical protein
MKRIGLFTLIFGLTFSSCAQNNQSTAETKNQTGTSSKTQNTKNRKEIQNLIRQALKWAGSNKSIDLLPAITDSKDSIYIGFDLEKLKKNLDKLRKTNFFSTAFIENYNQIILTLDRKIRGREYVEWLVGDLPTFSFANDVNPWCMCQDVPYDKPVAWDFVEINIIKLDNDKGDLDWKWGKLELNTDPSWKDFTYRFRVVKEYNKWKITYLKGFDFKESTRKDGQL